MKGGVGAIRAGRGQKGEEEGEGGGDGREKSRDAGREREKWVR